VRPYGISTADYIVLEKIGSLAHIDHQDQKHPPTSTSVPLSITAASSPSTGKGIPNKQKPSKGSRKERCHGKSSRTDR
jgi:hypothetical protein